MAAEAAVEFPLVKRHPRLAMHTLMTVVMGFDGCIGCRGCYHVAEKGAGTWVSASFELPRGRILAAGLPGTLCQVGRARVPGSPRNLPPIGHESSPVLGSPGP
jgi:hypothetical protein